MCTLYTYTNICMPRYSPSGFPSRCGKTDASNDGAALLGPHSQATGHGGRVSHTQRHVNSANVALNQTTFLTKTQALLGKAISEHTTQRNAELKSVINKDHQMVPKRMPLGTRLAVNTHKMGGHFDFICFYCWKQYFRTLA